MSEAAGGRRTPPRGHGLAPTSYQAPAHPISKLFTSSEFQSAHLVLGGVAVLGVQQHLEHLGAVQPAEAKSRRGTVGKEQVVDDVSASRWWMM